MCIETADIFYQL